MSYQFWQAVSAMIPCAFLAAFMLRAWLVRRLRPRLPTQPRRRRLRPWLRLMLVLAPLRFVAGQRPLFAKPMVPYLSPKQVTALEIQLGVRRPEVAAENRAVAAGRATINEARGAIPFEHFASNGGVNNFVNTGTISGGGAGGSGGSVSIAVPPAGSGDVLGRLQAQRQNCWAYLKNLSDSIQSEQRGYTRAERDEFDRVHEQLDQLDQRIRTVIEAEERMRGYERGRDEGADAIRRMEGYL